MRTVYNMKYLKDVKDIDFIINILQDKKNKCSNYYSPLSQKLGKIITKLGRYYNKNIEEIISQNIIEDMGK